jgi:hypothetical protein
MEKHEVGTATVHNYKGQCAKFLYLRVKWLITIGSEVLSYLFLVYEYFFSINTVNEIFFIYGEQ